MLANNAADQTKVIELVPLKKRTAA